MDLKRKKKKTGLKIKEVSKDHFSSNLKTEHLDFTRVFVHLIEGSNVLASDLDSGKSDPICFFWVGNRLNIPKPKASISEFVLSKVCKTTCDPIFDEKINIPFHVSDVGDLENLVCLIYLKDEDLDESDDSIKTYEDLGMIEIPFAKIFAEGKVGKNYVALSLRKYVLQKTPGMRKVDGSLKFSISIFFGEEDSQKLCQQSGSESISRLMGDVKSLSKNGQLSTLTKTMDLSKLNFEMNTESENVNTFESSFPEDPFVESVVDDDLGSQWKISSPESVQYPHSFPIVEEIIEGDIDPDVEYYPIVNPNNHDHNNTDMSHPDDNIKEKSDDDDDNLVISPGHSNENINPMDDLLLSAPQGDQLDLPPYVENDLVESDNLDRNRSVEDLVPQRSEEQLKQQSSSMSLKNDNSNDRMEIPPLAQPLKEVVHEAVSDDKVGSKNNRIDINSARAHPSNSNNKPKDGENVISNREAARPMSNSRPNSRSNSTSRRTSHEAKNDKGLPSIPSSEADSSASIPINIHKNSSNESVVSELSRSSSKGPLKPPPPLPESGDQEMEQLAKIMKDSDSRSIQGNSTGAARALREFAKQKDAIQQHLEELTKLTKANFANLAEKIEKIDFKAQTALSTATAIHSVQNQLIGLGATTPASIGREEPSTAASTSVDAPIRPTSAASKTGMGNNAKKTLSKKAATTNGVKPSNDILEARKQALERNKIKAKMLKNKQVSQNAMSSKNSPSTMEAQDSDSEIPSSASSASPATTAITRNTPVSTTSSSSSSSSALNPTAFHDFEVELVSKGADGVITSHILDLPPSGGDRMESFEDNTTTNKEDFEDRTTRRNTRWNSQHLSNPADNGDNDDYGGSHRSSKAKGVNWNRVQNWAASEDWSSCFLHVLDRGELEDVSRVMEMIGPKPEILPSSIRSRVFDSIATMLAQDYESERCLVWLLAILQDAPVFLPSFPRHVLRDLSYSLQITGQEPSRRGLLASLIGSQLESYLQPQSLPSPTYSQSIDIDRRDFR